MDTQRTKAFRRVARFSAAAVAALQAAFVVLLTGFLLTVGPGPLWLDDGVPLEPTHPARYYVAVTAVGLALLAVCVLATITFVRPQSGPMRTLGLGSASVLTVLTARYAQEHANNVGDSTDQTLAVLAAVVLLTGTIAAFVTPPPQPAHPEAPPTPALPAD